MTGIYPGDGKKIPVSRQLGQNSGELPFTQNFLAAQFFFFFFNYSFEYFFHVEFPYAVSNILSISIVTELPSSLHDPYLQTGQKQRKSRKLQTNQPAKLFLQNHGKDGQYTADLALRKQEHTNRRASRFRKGRCTEDQITLISQSIEDGFQEKKNTVAVWVDMEKAFDRVWKKGLSYKLQKYGVIGKMHQWITEYLRDRKARVKIQDHTSRCHTLKEGVP